MESNICPICLRTNRCLKVIHTTLSEYHYELTNYTLPAKNFCYCNDCEWLLRKTYNFQRKCVNAAKILKNWMDQSTGKKTLANLLHLKLPPISLNKWKAENTKFVTYTGNIDTSCPIKENLSNKQGAETFIVEINMPSKVDEVNVDAIKHENVKIKHELQDELHQFAGVSHTLSDGFEDSNNVYQDIINDNENQSTNTGMFIKNNIQDNKIRRILRGTTKAKSINSNRKGKLQSRTRRKTDKISTPKQSDGMCKLNEDIPKRRSKPRKGLGNKIVLHDTEDMNSELLSLNDEDIKNETIEIDDENEYLDNVDMYDLKERLKLTLENFGEMKTKDGFVFNKDIIVSSLDDDQVSQKIIKRLLHLMRGTNQLGQEAAKLLKTIQEKQQLSQYESVFDIEYMSTEKDKLAEFERRKTYECYVKAKNKCEICCQAFRGGLEYHKKTHDERHGQFSCHICHMRQQSRKNHLFHMSTHNIVYKCKLCPLVTYLKSSMVNHFAQHKGTIYECKTCGKIYKSRSVLKWHQTRAHPRGDHVCTTCGGAYYSQHGLSVHMNLKHRDDSPESVGGASFSCKECTLTFPSEEACSKHRRVTHGVRVKRHLLATKRKPRKKPVMTCPECKAVGHSHGWMVRHFDMEHPSLDVTKVWADKQIYLCDTCGKGFTTKNSLREHIATKHSDGRYPCPTCHKQFATRLKLRYHEVRHDAPRHCCDRCGKKFHAYSNLCNHMRIHVGDRCFKCHICEKGFLYRATLREHVRGVHKNERRVRKRGVREMTHGVPISEALEIGAEGVLVDNKPGVNNVTIANVQHVSGQTPLTLKKSGKCESDSLTLRVPYLRY